MDLHASWAACSRHPRCLEHLLDVIRGLANARRGNGHMPTSPMPAPTLSACHLHSHRYLDKRGVPLAAVQVQYSLLRCGRLLGLGRVSCLMVMGAALGRSPLQSQPESQHQLDSVRCQVVSSCAASPPYRPAGLRSRSRGSDQMAVKAACDDLGVALIAYSPLALGAWHWLHEGRAMNAARALRFADCSLRCRCIPVCSGAVTAHNSQLDSHCNFALQAC